MSLDVDFDSGTNHPGSGGQQLTNEKCGDCHPPTGVFGIMTRHEGVARAEEGEAYRGTGDGYSIESLTYDRATQEMTVDFSVTKDGEKMDLQLDPEWTGGGRLEFQVGWSTENYTNEGGGSSPAPAQPMNFPGLE